MVATAGDVPIHLDGARLFNAEAATGVAASVWADPVTTVMCCLSKGLCAPVGSLLAGPDEVIAEARLERKRLGGGMRQSGVLAAPGLLALETMVERLPEDHARAFRLAEAVAQRWPDCGLQPATVRTNIVTFAHPEPDKLLRSPAARRGAGRDHRTAHRAPGDPSRRGRCRRAPGSSTRCAAPRTEGGR